MSIVWVRVMSFSVCVCVCVSACVCVCVCVCVCMYMCVCDGDSVVVLTLHQWVDPSPPGPSHCSPAVVDRVGALALVLEVRVPWGDYQSVFYPSQNAPSPDSLTLVQPLKSSNFPLGVSLFTCSTGLIFPPHRHPHQTNCLQRPTVVV